MSKAKDDDGAAILVPPTENPAPAGKEAVRPLRATHDGDRLTVHFEGGQQIAVPKDAKVFCNGVANRHANIPGWLDFHATETKRIETHNDKRAAIGKEPVPPVPPVWMTVAESAEGVVVRFDQR